MILVGASVRAAAESARRAGFDVIAVDEFGDRETLDVARHWESLVDLADADAWRRFETNFEPSAKIAIVGGSRRGFDWIRSAPTRFLGLSPKWFERCDGPAYLKSLAASAGVGFPEIRPIDSDAAGWLIKKRPSSGGLGVRYHDGRWGQPHLRGCFAQRPVAGKVLGISYVGLGDRAVLVGACRLLKKRLGPFPFVFAGAIGPLIPAPAVRQRLQRLGDAFVQASGITGPFNVDVVQNGETIWLLEINPRFSASMEIVERAWGDWLGEPVSMFDAAAAWIRRIDRANRASDSELRSQRGYLKRVVFASRSQTVSPRDFGGASRDDRWCWKDVPARPMAVERHDPVATMIAPLDRLSLREAFRVIV